MDKAKILRLPDEADGIVSALYKQGANKDYKCKHLREKLRAIVVEISAPEKNDDARTYAPESGDTAYKWRT